MGRIVQPPPEDDFYSPELIRFSAAGFCVVSAFLAAYGLWLVVDSGCFGGECRLGDEGVGAFVLLIWGLGQIALSVVAVAGLAYLLIAARAHRTAISVASAGILATAGFCGTAIVGLLSG